MTNTAVSFGIYTWTIEMRVSYTHKRASPLSTLRIRVRASKHELPTIAAHAIPSSTVNQGGIRVRAIVKVSNKFRRASSSSRESRRVIRKIDFPGMHRMSGPVKI